MPVNLNRLIFRIKQLGQGLVLIPRVVVAVVVVVEVPRVVEVVMEVPLLMLVTVTKPVRLAKYL